MSSGQADLRDPDLLPRLRAALIRFAEQVRLAGDGAAGDLDATLHWLRQERLPALRLALRRAEEAVSTAAAALRFAQGMKPSCIDEELDLRRARARLDAVQRAQTTCQHGLRTLEREAVRAAPWLNRLRGGIDSGVPRALARLDGMRDAIERYLRPTASPTPTSAPEPTP